MVMRTALHDFDYFTIDSINDTIVIIDSATPISGQISLNLRSEKEAPNGKNYSMKYTRF